MCCPRAGPPASTPLSRWRGSSVDPTDYFLLGFGALRGHRLRSFLSMLGIAIGITAVVLLTSIGEGTRRYLIAEFTQFGTNVLAINPGKTETAGLPGILGTFCSNASGSESVDQPNERLL